MAHPIEDYALIGNCETAALVARDGSIDWLCWPRFDSDACFAALLGTPEHGRWQIAPADPGAKITRRYRDDTLILETEFETGDGVVTLIDFMPLREGDKASQVVRLVKGQRGQVAMSCELVLRFNYGSSVPWVTRLDDGALRAIAGPDMTVLRTPVELHGDDLKTVGKFLVSEGETVPFVLSYGRSFIDTPAQPIEPDRRADRHRDVLAQLVGGLPPGWQVVGRRASVPDHAQGACLSADRRHRRRANHLAARATRRTAELGLSLLLAPGRYVHLVELDERRLL